MIYGKHPIGTIAYMGGVMSVPEVFCWSWSQMIQYNSDYLCESNESIHYERSTISYHSAARNNLVDRMKGNWLLMLDTDHKFEPDIAARLSFLMNKHKIDVISGIYQYKSPPYSLVAYVEEKNGLAMLGDWDKDVKIFEIASTGAGCLMIKRNVFERIKNELNEGPFDIIHPFSEDHSFFKRLEKLKIKAYCCPDIESNHLVVKPITLEDYQKDGLSLGGRKVIQGFK